VRGSLDDIGIGPEGSVIGVRKRRGVWKYNELKKKWYKIGKFGSNVAVGPGGKPHIITAKGSIFAPDVECPDQISLGKSKTRPKRVSKGGVEISEDQGDGDLDGSEESEFFAEDALDEDFSGEEGSLFRAKSALNVSDESDLDLGEDIDV